MYQDEEEDKLAKNGQNLHFWATLAASKKLANAHANHIIFYLNINMYFGVY